MRLTLALSVLSLFALGCGVFGGDEDTGCVEDCPTPCEAAMDRIESKHASCETVWALGDEYPACDDESEDWYTCVADCVDATTCAVLSYEAEINDPELHSYMACLGACGEEPGDSGEVDDPEGAF